MPEPQFHAHPDRAALAEVLAGRIAAALEAAIGDAGKAVLAVSGGSTPRKLFEALARAAIDWRRVTVLPVDERFVPPGDERSNQRLVAAHLLRDAAADAAFLPLWCPAPSLAGAARAASAEVAALGRAPDVAVLGLGLDGHTASWFPKSPELAAALDPRQHAPVLGVTAPDIPEDRLTLTLPLLACAGFVILHIEGWAKKRALDAALAEGPVEERPVRAVLRRAELQIHWAP